MKRIAFVAVLVGMCVTVGLLVSPGGAQTTSVRGADAEKLTALRKERRDALRQVVKDAEESYRNGLTQYNTSLPRVAINLLNAELDLATDRAGRISVREQMVDHFREIEKLVSANVEAGLWGANKTDLLEVKAERLRAEIELLLETADKK
jgi:hypothetical protein